MNDRLRVLAFFLGPYRGRITLVALLAVATGVLEMLLVASIYPLVTTSVAPDASGDNALLSLLSAAAQVFPFEPALARVAALFTALVFLGTAVRLLSMWYQLQLASQVVTGAKRQLFERMLGLDYAYFVRNKRGDLVYRLWTAPSDLAQVVWVLGTLSMVAFTSLILLAFLFTLSWPITLAVLVLGLLYQVLTARYLRQKVYDNATRSNAAGQEANVVINEALDGVRHVKAYRMEPLVVREHARTVDQHWTMWRRANFYSRLPNHLVRAATFGALGIGLVALAMTQGSAIAVLLPTYAALGFGYLRLVPSMAELAQSRLLLSQAMPRLELVHRTLTETVPQIRDGTVPFTGLQREIAFADVGFAHAGGGPVLRGFRGTLPKNKSTALVGASGAGKSTVVDLLLRLYDPERGTILVDGTDLAALQLGTWRSRVALVGQEPFILHGTVEQNIRFGLEGVTPDQVVEAARGANADAFVRELSKGYDTVLGDRGVRLSGGQKQRIAIARALLRRPDLLILDEATSALDNVSESAVQSTLRDVSRHTTIVMVAHRLSTVRWADKIVVLESGVNAEEGTHDELLRRRGAYWRLYQTAPDAEAEPPVAAAVVPGAG